MNELSGNMFGYSLYSFDRTIFAFIGLYGPDFMDLRGALEQGLGSYVVGGAYDADFGDELVGSSNGMETISVTGAGTSPRVSFASIRAYQKDSVTAFALVMDRDEDDKPDLEQGDEILDSIAIELP